MKARALALVAATCACVEWTRFTGNVKAINLKASTVTIQIKGGDLVTIPVDYQVKVTEGKGELRSLKDLQLDEKVTLLRVPADKPQDDTEGLVPPQH